ncbi:MAG: ADP-ribosylglycohydrolase family protein [Deltaproteobacteria bacterium]|nr:ADP-ribosylglycohydrolase family protein [Deltaproteobacteria bacterium]MBP6831600.1 ADP-ribosylglycohydrolase family protein [Deltaproteobacteria bacterium]
MDLPDRLAGTLLGTALGDALGLPMEMLSPRVIARRFPRLDRFHMLGRVGFVSDDTEQSALVAQSLARHPGDPDACVWAFRRSLLGWFLRLPWGIGLGTLRACARIAVGLRRSGVATAGNGAAMRAAIVGVFFHDDEVARRSTSDALARVTHTDPRAVEGARFVAEVAAMTVKHGDPAEALEAARAVVTEATLAEAIGRAMALAREGAALDVATEALGTTGFVVHTVPFAAYAFARWGRDPMEAIAAVIRAGGDTDSIGAIVGAWCGALGGEGALPGELVGRIHDGPFGPTHLRALAADLAGARLGRTAVAEYSPVYALARNLALYPVVLAHAARRIIPY